MSRKWLAYLGVPAVALAGLLLMTPTASAQRFGRFGGVGLGFGSGYGYGNGFGLGMGNYGWGSPYYGNSFYGNNYYGNRFGGYGWNNGWNNGYYNNVYSPGWSSNWNSYPGNYGYTWNSYPSTTYSTYQPAYSYGGQQFASMPHQGTTSFYSADHAASNIPETAAWINVRVPPDATITFSDEQTKQQGPFRQFYTPALDKGQTYYYMVHVQWNENGQNMERTRKVLVRAGDRINLDVAPDMTAVDEMTPAHLPNRSQSGYEGTTDHNRANTTNSNPETIPAPSDRSNLPNTNDNLNRSTNPAPATTNPAPATTNPAGTSGTTNTPGTNR